MAASRMRRIADSMLAPGSAAMRICTKAMVNVAGGAAGAVMRTTLHPNRVIRNLSDQDRLRPRPLVNELLAGVVAQHHLPVGARLDVLRQPRDLSSPPA